MAVRPMCVPSLTAPARAVVRCGFGACRAPAPSQLSVQPHMGSLQSFQTALPLPTGGWSQVTRKRSQPQAKHRQHAAPTAGNLRARDTLSGTDADAMQCPARWVGRFTHSLHDWTGKERPTLAAGIGPAGGRPPPKGRSRRSRAHLTRPPARGF